MSTAAGRSIWRLVKSFSRAFLIFPILSLFLGCDSNKKAQSLIDSYGLNPKETISIILPKYPQSLDWTTTIDRDSSVIETNLMAGLTNFEVKGTDVKIVPELAQKWEASENGLKYIFKLKDGVLWSDGTPLTAQHFIDGFKRLLDSSSPWADSLFVVKNAKQYHQRQLKNFSDVGIKAPDDHTLVFNLSSVESYFPDVFANHSLYPVRLDLIEKHKESWFDPENLVTLGAYTLVGSQKDHLLILKRNEKYALKKAAIKNIVLRFSVKAQDALALFTAGQINAIVDIQIPDLKIFQDRDDLYFSPLLEMNYLTFDLRSKPLENPIFRRVVAMAIDRDDLAHSLSDAVRPLSSMVPPGLTGFESNRGVRYDPEDARGLQKRSALTNLEKYGKFYLKTDDSPSSTMAAQNITEQLKKNLGLDLEVVDSAKDTGKSPTLLLLHWWANIPDPDNFLGLFTAGSLNNKTGWKNHDYDEFVHGAASASSIESKEKLYAKAQHLLTEREMPVVPLFMGTEYCLLQKKIHHFPLNILGQLSLSGVTLE